MSLPKKLDVLIWGHSDQAGGTEMSCAIASALMRSTCGRISCCVFTRSKKGAKNFLKYEYPSGKNIHIVQVESQLALEKNKRTGKVDRDKTLKNVIGLSKKPIHKLLTGKPYGDVKKRLHSHGLIISCGEPIAIKFAQECKCKSIIVTDHLITQTVRSVLRKEGSEVNNDVWDYIASLERFELDANEAFLSPPEFGMPAYRDYLIRRGRKCIEIDGTFYVPPLPNVLQTVPHYNELKKLNSENPIVIVFGGGGNVWDGIYRKLHKKVRREGLSKFSLILRDIEENKVLRKWRLFEPGEKNKIKEKPLEDPGKMMYWYSTCTLLVGRGGLAAQQIITITMHSAGDSVPGMLFVEEPDHPQIESERIQLWDMGLVDSYGLDRFRKNPLAIIEKTLDQKESFKRRRERAHLRYGEGMIDRLADYVLSSYEPHKRE